MSIHLLGNRVPTPKVHYFLQGIERCTCEMAYRLLPEGPLHSEIQSVHLGSVVVSRHLGYGTQSCERNRRHITAGFADFYILCIPLKSRFSVQYGGQRASAPDESFVLLSTRSPFSADVSGLGHHHRFEGLYLRVPGALVRARAPRIDDVCGKFFRISPGITHYLKAQMEAALCDGLYLGNQEKASTATLLIELLTETTLGILADSPPQERQSLAGETLAKAKRFIAENLSHPELAPAMVANHFHVSVRYLQSLFAAEATAVGRYIREQRLQRCHQALSDPSLRDTPVMAIAEQWGFRNASHFCRAYKARFGSPANAGRAAIAMT